MLLVGGDSMTDSVAPFGLVAPSESLALERGTKKAGGPIQPSGSAWQLVPWQTYEGQGSPLSGAPLGAPIRSRGAAVLVRRTVGVKL
ncbi:hypothetical protein BH18CHL1_BH18CHL1_04730 [soil metagenome]